MQAAFVILRISSRHAQNEYLNLNNRRRPYRLSHFLSTPNRIPVTRRPTGWRQSA